MIEKSRLMFETESGNQMAINFQVETTINFWDVRDASASYIHQLFDV